MAYDSQSNASICNASICMEGGKRLTGTVRIQGSKNAALPVLAASVLIPDTCVFQNVPYITDIGCMENLLRSTGAVLEKREAVMELCIDARNIREYRLPARYVSAMRSSVVLMGALLGRIGEALVDYPGGCVIGKRPIDLHLFGLEKLGAQIWTDKNRIHAYADELRGALIRFPFPSVGATQNTILAAVTARGTTVIQNAAREPEVTALCEFLNKAGADIVIGHDFIATGRIVIHGVDVSCLHGVTYTVIPDRIVAGTYMYDVICDKIQFDANYHVTLGYGGVKVNIGALENLDEKIMQLPRILPSLEGEKGVLDLQNYSSDKKTTSFEREK